MKIDEEVIEVNKKEYTVVSTLNKSTQKFAYIINNDNYNDVLFVKLNKNELEVIEDKKVLKELIKLFNKKINEKKLMESC